MKNSAWYHKLWHKRLSELPVKEADEVAWINMRNLLDEHLPVDATNNPAPTSPGIALFRSTAYIIAAAAIISTTIYMLAHHSKQTSGTYINKKHHDQPDTKNLTQGHQQVDDSGNQQHVSPNHDSVANNEASTGNQPDIAATGHQNTTAGQPANTSARKAANADQYTTSNSDINKANNSTNPRVNTPTTRSKINQYYDIDDLQKSKSYKPGNDSKRYYSHQQSSSLFITKINGSSSGRRLVNGVSSSNTSSGNRIGLTTHQTAVAKHQQSKMAKPGANDAESTTKPERATENAIGSSKIDMGKPANNQPQDKSAANNNEKEAAGTKIDPVKNTANNTDTKEVKNSGSRSRVFNTSPKTVKSKDNKTKSNTKKTKTNNAPPQYNYGLEAGYNASHGNSLYAGAFASYQVKPKWLINIGLRLNTYRTVSGEYSHPSYYRPDSLPAFKITDSRKLILLDIPLTLEYRLSDLISFNAGPVISIPLKQSGINYKIGPIVNKNDTLYHTKTIDSTMKQTTLNKVNFGGTVGITLHIKQFNIDARYRVITPYKLSNGFGSYSQSAKSFQIGIGYRFK